MIECDNCGKSYKTQRNLDKHLLKCKPKEKVLSDVQLKKIAKTKSAIASCQDAEAKHKLEMELKAIENGTL